MSGTHGPERYMHEKEDQCAHCSVVITRRFVSHQFMLERALEDCTLKPVHRCYICMWKATVTKLNWPRELIIREEAKPRDAEMARRAKMNAIPKRDTDTDGFDLRLHDGESWFGCALGEQTRVCFRSRNTR
jgi:hypothetical protein